MPRENKISTRAITMIGQQLCLGAEHKIERGLGHFKMQFIMPMPGVGVGINVVAPYGAPVVKDAMVQTEPRTLLPVLLRLHFDGLIVEPEWDYHRVV
jgi:hypothetical protein